jgi:NADPH:quinone reductase-like Zn-dependent oxidoreductase
VSDGAGEVVEVGAGVQSVKPGDRVTSCFMPAWLEGELTPEKQSSALGYLAEGVLAEYVVLPESGILSAPEHLSFQEAATLPCAALTAWNALTRGNVLPGKIILVQGTGGVSLFALQFAKLFGARVIALSSNDTKIKRLKDLGASLTINYRSTPDWQQLVMDYTNGKGVDHIIEVGGASTLDKSLAAIKYGGTISIIGHVGGDIAPVNLRDILRKDVILQGVYVGSRKMFEAMNAAISLHKLKPVLDKSFPFDQAKEAMQYLESGAHFGKVCITV